MIPVGYQSGTFWAPTESVTAFTLSQSSLGYSPVWTSLFFNVFLSKKSLYYVYNMSWYRIINKLLLLKKLYVYQLNSM